MAIQIRSTLIFFCSRTTTFWTDRRFNEFHLHAGQVANLVIGQMANLCPPDLPEHGPGTSTALPAASTSLAPLENPKRVSSEPVARLSTNSCET